MSKALQLAAFLLLILGVRWVNAPDVFIGNGVYFVDADCYSRMTRVAAVLETPGRVVRHHSFENWPEGTVPHTTAPLDYLIAGVALGLSPFTDRALDLAGALTSPLLALAGGIFLWFWCGPRPCRGALMLLFAVSPGLAHATALGRPDHQSLLLLLLAVALGAEWKLAQASRERVWSLVAGGAWGLALWVSLFEPAVLLGLVLLCWLIGAPRQMVPRERLWGCAVLVGILALALVVEGMRLAVPADTALFARWLGTIGETVGGIRVAFAWTGWGLFAAPILLMRGAGARGERLAALVVLAVLFALTWHQARWGYFLALAYAMSLPWQLEQLRPRWLVWCSLAILLWPLWSEWDRRLWPPEQLQAVKIEQRRDGILLRQAALWLASQPEGAVVAPWWQSPALAWWSGQPAVAGSSHQSLPGIVATARFYAATDWAAAEELLKEKNVRYILAYEDERVLLNAGQILGETALSGDAMASVLFRSPNSAPPFLRLAFANEAFKVFVFLNHDD